MRTLFCSILEKETLATHPRLWSLFSEAAFEKKIMKLWWRQQLSIKVKEILFGHLNSEGSSFRVICQFSFPEIGCTLVINEEYHDNNLMSTKWEMSMHCYACFSSHPKYLTQFKCFSPPRCKIISMTVMTITSLITTISIISMVIISFLSKS